MSGQRRWQESLAVGRRCIQQAIALGAPLIRCMGSRIASADMTEVKVDWPWLLGEMVRRGYPGYLSIEEAGESKLGYIEKKEERGTEFYKVTESGIGEFQRTRCGYCGVSRWKLKVSSVDCRICGKDHWICQRCSRENVIVVGEFPKYRPALRGCPKEKT